MHVQRRCVAETVFPPNLFETLPFAVVVAEHMHDVVLARPAMELREKFFPLRLGNVRFGWAVADRTEDFEALETDVFLRIEIEIIGNLWQHLHFTDADLRELARLDFILELVPIDEKRIAVRNLFGVALRVFTDG